MLKQALEFHRHQAQQSHKYYIDTTKKCRQEWEEITQLEGKASLTDEEKAALAVMRNKFTLVVSADYQMSKLVPYWGMAPQPGSTYYLQKLNHDVYGIVNHATDSSAVYLFDERIGPKNTDHTISYTTQYISKLPDWVCRVHLFLDNTCSTNKNFYLMGWAWEMVQQKRLDLFRISFLIAGHTIFGPDLLFSKIAKTYNNRDVFSTTELKDEVIGQYADVTLDDGAIVCVWREAVAKKYSKMPGIRNLHDFVFSKHCVTGEVVARTRTMCYSGQFTPATMHILAGQNATERIEPQTYEVLKKKRSLSESKMSNLKQMYQNFIPAERWLEFLL